jgi:hypothetical protein
MAAEAMPPRPARTAAGYLTWLALLLGIFVGLCALAALAGKLLFGEPLQFEIRFMQWLASIRIAQLNTVERGFTFLGSTLWLVCVSLLVSAWLLFKRRTADVALLLAAGLGSSAITNLVKVLVARARPEVVPHLDPVTTLELPFRSFVLVCGGLHGACAHPGGGPAAWADRDGGRCAAGGRHRVLARPPRGPLPNRRSRRSGARLAVGDHGGRRGSLHGGGEAADRRDTGVSCAGRRKLTVDATRPRAPSLAGGTIEFFR